MYGRKLTESVMGLLFAAATGPVKLHTDPAGHEESAGQSALPRKAVNGHDLRKHRPKIRWKIPASEEVPCFRCPHVFTGSDCTRSTRLSVAARAR